MSETLRYALVRASRMPPRERAAHDRDPRGPGFYRQAPIGKLTSRGVETGKKEALEPQESQDYQRYNLASPLSPQEVRLMRRSMTSA